jgi:hypothetical protein
MSAWGMLKQGKIGDAAKRVVVSLLPAWLANLVLKLWDNLWQMALASAGSYAEEVLSGRLTINEAAEKLMRLLAAQSVKISKDTALDAIRLRMIERKDM